MTKKSLVTCFTLLSSASLFCPTAECVASETSGFRITVHIYNYYTVSEKTLARAKDEACRIFKLAGLTVTWADQDLNAGSSKGPENSTGSWDQTHFVLRLLKQARPGLHAHATGEAFSFRIANVFLDRVMSQSVLGEIFIGQLLGHAMAHEIGHLVLGENSHGSSGIMLASWSKNDMKRMSRGDLMFTSEQVKQIHTRLLLLSMSQETKHAKLDLQKANRARSDEATTKP